MGYMILWDTTLYLPPYNIMSMLLMEKGRYLSLYISGTTYSEIRRCRELSAYTKSKTN